MQYTKVAFIFLQPFSKPQIEGMTLRLTGKETIQKSDHFIIRRS